MPHPKYSKNQYQRDLVDGIAKYDDEALAEFARAKVPALKSGRPAAPLHLASPTKVRLVCRDAFDAAYRRHMATLNL